MSIIEERNPDLHKVVDIWERDGQQIKTEGMLGWADPEMEEYQKQSKANQDMKMRLAGFHKVRDIIKENT